MCYSAQIEADYDKFIREWGAIISIKRFVELFWEKRKDGQWVKIPKAMREAFRKPASEDTFELAKLVAEGGPRAGGEIPRRSGCPDGRVWQKAEDVLAGPKPTKKATDDKRIATDKISRAQRNLDDLTRKEPKDRRLAHLPGHLCAGDDREGRSAHRRSHALPVPIAWLE